MVSWLGTVTGKRITKVAKEAALNKAMAEAQLYGEPVAQREGLLPRAVAQRVCCRTPHRGKSFFERSFECPV